MTYGTCTECGYDADTWEMARIHVRDTHNGFPSGPSDYFEVSEE